MFATLKNLLIKKLSCRLPNILSITPFNCLSCFKASSGSALILAVLTIMVVFTLGVSLVSIATNNYYMDHAERDYQAAYYVAEGTLRHQIEAMRLHMEEIYASGNYNDADSFFMAFIEGFPVSPPEFIADFNRQVDASVSVSSGNRQGDAMTFTIEAVGTVGTISRRLKGSVEIRWVGQSTIFKHVLFANDTITVGNNAIVRGDMATNTTASKGVTLGNNSQIYGHVYIGPGGNPSKVVEKGHNCTMTGQIKVSDEIVQLPPIVPPSDLDQKNDLIIDNNATQYVNGGGRFNKIEINNNATLVVYLDGDTVIHTTTLSVGNNAAVKLQGSGRLLLYVDSVFNVSNNAIINNNREPSDLILLYSGSRTVIANNAFFKGGIYAPFATVNIENNAKFTGSIVAEKAIIGNNAEIVFGSVAKNGLPMPIKDYEAPGAGGELFTVVFYGEE